MTTTGETGRSATAGRWLIGALVVLSALHIWRPHGSMGTATYLAVTLGMSAVGLWLAAGLPAPQRRAWWWLAAGMTCSGVADLVFELVSWRTGANPDFSIADGFYLASYVLLGYGLYSLHATPRRLDVDLLVDLGSITLLSILVTTQLVDVSGILADHSTSMAAKAVMIAYPVFDAAVVAGLLHSLLGRDVRRAPGVLLAVGMTCWLAADFANLLIADASIETTFMDLGWMWGAAAVAIAVSFVRTSDTLPDVRRREELNLLIGLVPLAVPGIIEISAQARGTDPNPVTMYPATVGLIALAVVRAWRLLRERDERQAELAHRERYYRTLAMSSAEAVMVIGPDGRLLNDAPHLAELLGVDCPAIAGAVAADLLMPSEPDRAEALLDRLRATIAVVSETVIRAEPADGSDRWLALRALNLTDDPDVGGLVINVLDVTDRQRAEDELTHLAFHDTLTGLPNRALFNDRIDHAMRRNQRTGYDVAVVYLDLDGFKTVNDGLGHDIGDDVLRQVAVRLSSAVRPADTVARLGGDEFAIVIEAAEQPLEQASAVADRVLQAMAAPMRVGDEEMVLSASIGIALSDPTSTSSSMLRDADIAMYQAKSSGKGRWALYDADMRSVVVERMQLETDLVRAVADGEFEVVYQPIVRLASGEVAGFEALLRWHHPSRGLIMPDEFVPIAEETGAIVQIGMWVLDQACAAASAWQRERPERSTSIAVNMSAREVTAPNIVEHVRRALVASGLDPNLLVLELTESSLVRDPAFVARRLHDLHALGVKIAVDDFGTGYSSLSYLRQFPVDILKIDQSFVSTITATDTTPAILRGLLDLANTLDLETVAEGIELDAQRDSLRAQHCDFGQGFLLARPLSAVGASELLEREQVAIV